MNDQTPLKSKRLAPVFRMAVMAGIKASVQLHVQLGGDVNATDDKGRTPLILAASRGHAEICRLLLEAGADPTHVDQDGNDALRAAVAKDHHTIAEQLRAALVRISPSTEVPVADLAALAKARDDACGSLLPDAAQSDARQPMKAEWVETEVQAAVEMVAVIVPVDPVSDETVEPDGPPLRLTQAEPAANEAVPEGKSAPEEGASGEQQPDPPPITIALSERTEIGEATVEWATVDQDKPTDCVPIAVGWPTASPSAEGEGLDVSAWEEETESPPPPSDITCVIQADALQRRLSRHVPIDMDENWDDVDIDLPEILAVVRRWARLEGEQESALKELMLATVTDGRVKADLLERIAPRDQDAPEEPDQDYIANLRVMLGDLGIVIDDDPTAPDCPSESDDDDDGFREMAAEGLAFLRSLNSNSSDPLSLYLKGLSGKRLTRDEETSLAMAIEKGTRDALAALAMSSRRCVRVARRRPGRHARGSFRQRDC